MLNILLSLVALASSAIAITIPETGSYPAATGTRSLWIPFKTASDVSASILGRNEKLNITTYVLSCPTSDAQCALAPNLTLTEGPEMAEYITSNSAGFATLSCAMNITSQASPVVCNQIARDSSSNEVMKTNSILSDSQITFQPVAVTSLVNTTAEALETTSSTTSSTSSSVAGVPIVTSGPWTLGGAVGAGLVALAAL